MAHRRLRPGLIALTLAALAAAAPAQDKADSRFTQVFRWLERDAETLAEAGWPEQSDQVLEVVSALGQSDRALERARERCAKAKAKAAIGHSPVPSLPRRLSKAAAEVARVAAEEPDDAQRERLAKLAIRLDGRDPKAHETLGHVKVGDTWVHADMVPLFERGRAADEAVARAKALEVPVVTGPTDLAFLSVVQGPGGKKVSWENVSIHSAGVAEARLTEVLTGLLRAMALSNWCRTGELEIPEPRDPFRVILCSSHGQYLDAIKLSAEEDGLTQGNATVARQTSRYEDSRGWHVLDAENVAWWQSSLLVELWHVHHFLPRYAHVQPCLAVGHVNWLSLQVLGRHIPGFVWVEKGSGRTADTPADAKQRQELIDAAKRSYAGTRAYMAWLVSRDEDPPYARCVVERLGHLKDEPFLKATVMAAYLQDAGRFFPLADTTAKKPRTSATFEEALGHSLLDLETAFRAWLLPEARGLAQTVAP